MKYVFLPRSIYDTLKAFNVPFETLTLERLEELLTKADFALICSYTCLVSQEVSRLSNSLEQAFGDAPVNYQEVDSKESAPALIAHCQGMVSSDKLLILYEDGTDKTPFLQKVVRAFGKCFSASVVLKDSLFQELLSA